jgi:predicted nuclease of predicted toxin-antitoxin system
MKLLFDQNLSPKLVDRLADLFPGSKHVSTEGLDTATDSQVWDFARPAGFTIVTKDADYETLSVVRGSPPKVVWILLGNCTLLKSKQHFALGSLILDCLKTILSRLHWR